jgi:hypothetical protein
MENKLTKIFQKAKYESGAEMAPAIWRAIALRDKRITLFKLWISVCTGLASLAGLIPTAITLSNDLSHSGLYEYFSLVFGEGWSVLSYWKELAFSIAQSLPITNIVFTLSLIFVFFLSLRYVFKEIDKNQSFRFATLSA